MPHDARMTMKRKMLRGLIAGVVGLTAALTAVSGGGLPGSAATCQRSIAIDPQVTVSEASRTLTFVVHTNACAAAGYVSFQAVDGTAKRQIQGLPGGDYVLEDGVLEWQAGDLSSRRITATIIGDGLREQLLEDFRVVFGNASPNIRIAGRGAGQARIFDNDGQPRYSAIDDAICLISGRESCDPSATGDTVVPFMGPIGTQTFEPTHLLIALNQPNPVDTTITVLTTNGGLVAGVDFLPPLPNVTIPAGALAVVVEFQLLPHAFTQPGGSFTAQISGYSAGTVADPEATYTMLA